MSDFIIFVCSGLFVYWFSRTLLLLKRSKAETDEILESDLWWCRILLLGIRTMFESSTQLAGW